MTERIENLKKFGTEFQIKCISTLLSERTFIERIYDIIQLDYFEAESQRWVVDKIITYFVKYKSIPTLDCFKVFFDDVTKDSFKKEIRNTLELVYNHIDSPDLKFIQEQFLEFCRNQKLKNAITSSVDYLNNGEYDKIKHIVDEAMKAGMERNVGHDYLEDIDVRMSSMARDTVKTGWFDIDSILDGGLAAGELGVIVAPAGIGKSWFLAKLGAAAMMNGKNVAHFTLELNENYVGLRYDACFTGIDFQNIRNNVDLVKEKIKDVSGKLFIKYFPLKTVSAHGIRNHIQRLATLGTNTDLVVVDYADILKSTSNNAGSSNSYQEAGGIYEDLRSIAGELQIPVWTASQANRAATTDDIIEAGNISDSYRKIMTADFVMSVSRKTSDKAANTARTHIIKNRFGPDGITFPTKMNANCGDIQIFDAQSSEGMQIYEMMNKDDNEAANTLNNLKNKWNSN